MLLVLSECLDRAMPMCLPLRYDFDVALADQPVDRGRDVLLLSGDPIEQRALAEFTHQLQVPGYALHVHGRPELRRISPDEGSNLEVDTVPRRPEMHLGGDVGAAKRAAEVPVAVLLQPHPGG